MVINYLDVKRIAISPNETDAILIVDTDTVLPFPISLQRFKVVPGEETQVCQSSGSVQLNKLSLRYSPDTLETTRALAIE